MNIYNYINDLDINVGETKRMNCPSCNGYKTFTVTNEMGSLKWNCYKASCTISGVTKVSLSGDDILSVFKPVDKKVETFVLPEHVVKISDTHTDAIEWLDKWSLSLDYLYDVKENRVVFPSILDGKMIDASGRALGKRLPKWKRYGQSSLPYVCGSGSVAVVVEDCVSASAVGSNQPFTGVALLGTALTEPTKRFLSRFSTAVVALDPDALSKSISIANELRAYVSNVKILNLKDDLKYRVVEDWAKLYRLSRAS